MLKEKGKRESECEFISLAVCAIGLSEGNANGSCVSAWRPHFLFHVVLCFVLGPESTLPLSGLGWCREKNSCLGERINQSSLLVLLLAKREIVQSWVGPESSHFENPRTIAI
jgi:hypothetical protein